MTNPVHRPSQRAKAEFDEEMRKPQRLLEIFRQLQAGEISEEEAVKALEARRLRRFGRVGRFVEAITS